jgi:hypothetical protein
VEIKSSATPSADVFAALERLEHLARNLPVRERKTLEKIVVYGGDDTQQRSAGLLLSWADIDDHDWLA